MGFIDSRGLSGVKVRRCLNADTRELHSLGPLVPMGFVEL